MRDSIKASHIPPSAQTRIIHTHSNPFSALYRPTFSVHFFVDLSVSLCINLSQARIIDLIKIKTLRMKDVYESQTQITFVPSILLQVHFAESTGPLKHSGLSRIQQSSPSSRGSRILCGVAWPKEASASPKARIRPKFFIGLDWSQGERSGSFKRV